MIWCMREHPRKAPAFRYIEYSSEPESMKDAALYEALHGRLQTLGKKINLFIQSVEKRHRVEA